MMISTLHISAELGRWWTNFGDVRSQDRSERSHEKLDKELMALGSQAQQKRLWSQECRQYRSEQSYNASMCGVPITPRSLEGHLVDGLATQALGCVQILSVFPDANYVYDAS